MKTQIFRFILYSIVANLTCLNLTAASSPPSGENGVHFCGVTEQQSDTRRYARSLANLDVGEPRVVRLIYFLPSDRAPEQDIDTKLDTMIKNVQKFYADEMERHGFGRKTFTFEINADGNALVHHVGGRFTSSYYSGNLNIHDLSGKVISEIADRRNRSTNMYLVAVDSGWGGGGTGGGNPSGGSALITIERERFDTSTYLTLRELGYLTAHELGHAFGLSHDFRDPVNIMAYRSGVSPQLSRCNAEWLDAHRYFNPGQVDFDISPTIRMLPPLVSPPNGTRLRFEVTDADGLHQAQLIIPSTISDPTPGVKLWGCKTLSGESDTVEFIMTDLTPNTKEIWLAVINIHGNWTWQNFPIDVASLLPAEVAVSIPTEHLAAAVRQALGLPPSDDITEQSMLELTRLTLNPGNIVNLAGLEHARNLVWLHLRHNQVGDISPLAGLRSLANLELGYNNISDIGPFAGLTRLTILNLPDNNISAVSPLAGLARLKILDLARNNISDIKPIAGLTDLYSLRLSDNSISDISVVAGLTNLTELYLSDNNVSDISAVAGLNNLTQLSLGGNISDIAAVARLTNLTRLILWRNNISDISAVAALTDLTVLGLESNSITDISPVSGLTNLTELYLANNNISDILPLVENTGLGGGDRINVWRNPLSYASINTHIPDLQERGVEVFFHNRTPRRIRNVSGDDQRGSPGTTLEKPFVVEVQDERSVAFEGVPVTFTVTAGDGTLHTTRTATDSNGRAESTLTLGPNPGTNTVTVSVAGSQEKETFNAEGVRTPKTLEIFSGGDQEGAPGAALENPFVVEVRDQTDKPLPGVQVTFSVSSGGGTLSATSATTDSNGRAEGFLTLGPNPGTNTVEVAATGIQEKQTFNAEGIRIPETLDIVSGNDQEGLSGAALENPFVVEVRDQTDKPLPGVQVTFSVTSGGGTLSATSVTTNSNGRAESTLTLEPNQGINTVTVSVTGIQEQQTFTAEGIRIPLAFWIISGDKQQGLLGEALANPFVVEVRGQSGDPLPGVQVTFSVSSGGGTLSATITTTDNNGRVKSTLTLGPNPGTNTVKVAATGIHRTQSVSAIAELPPIPQDVNRDDMVNILDLVLVASVLGDEGRDLDADVNRDGVVNILDLVLVAGALGNVAAAPSAWYRDLEIAPTRADVGQWLAQAGELELTEATSQRGVLFLEQLLAALIPKETALFPNFPNPFNPETWMPYQLAEDAFVTLTIYDGRGRAVRTLEIGHRISGFYEDRSQAIYWDGRNDFGEGVASGVYFYHLSAGDYSATRKMLIIK